MDVTFHYFTVKTLAKAAGFEETEAQRIATYSQYIDDFDWISYLDCRNLPDYIKKNDHYDLYVPSILTLNLNFNPVMTGFIDIVDMTFLLLERTQKFTVSPFHFIPPSIGQIAKQTRTVSAIIGDGSLISDVLMQARDLFLKGAEPRKNSLMRIGMSLHTFADTYAHQLFSGYNSWVNDVKVTKVIDNRTNTNIIEAIDETNAVLPCIGHMWALNIPDRTNLSFELLYKENENEKGYSKTYMRSNTETFVTAAKHILDYLRSCLGKEAVKESEWNTLKKRLIEAFLQEYPSTNIEAELAQRWHRIFPECDYFYSKAQMEKGFYVSNSAAAEDENSIFGKDYTDEFYHFNVLADEFLIRIYGEHPRRSWWTD